MPYFDMTGPLGSGPRTGRGLGSCLGFNNSNSLDFATWKRMVGDRFPRMKRRISNKLNLSKDEEKKLLELESKKIKDRLKELSK